MHAKAISVPKGNELVIVQLCTVVIMLLPNSSCDLYWYGFPWDLYHFFTREPFARPDRVHEL